MRARGKPDKRGDRRLRSTAGAGRAAQTAADGTGERECVAFKETASR